MPHAPNIYTIPASRPFFETLAQFVLGGQTNSSCHPERLASAKRSEDGSEGSPSDCAHILGDPSAQPQDDISPFALANTTIFFPTRRACKNFELELLRQAGTQALILPRIIPVRDVGEIGLEHEDISETTVTPTQRVWVLARLILQWKQAVYAAVNAGHTPKWHNPNDPIFIQISHAECVALAQDLANTLDQLTLEHVSAHAIADMIPTEFLGSHELNLGFLNIVLQQWPQFLQDHSLQDPIVAWDEAIHAMAQRIEAGQFGRVIAAGSTGSTPATAELLAAIARSPYGTLIIPGLDTQLSVTAWAAIGAAGQAETHPQIHLKRLLTTLHIAHPADVPILGRITPPPLLETIVSYALQPASTTDEWHSWRVQQCDAELMNATAHVTLLEAAHEEEEALSIALQLRLTAATPHETAALITPNRTLARRVCAHLQAFGVDVPDSGGLPLLHTMPGRAARLLLDALAAPQSPAAALAFLRHPMVQVEGVLDLKTAVTALECALFRGIAPAGDWNAALAHNFETWQNAHCEGAKPHQLTHAQKSLTLEDWHNAQAVLEGYLAAIAPFLALQTADNPHQPFATYNEQFAQIFAALVPVVQDEDIPKFSQNLEGAIANREACLQLGATACQVLNYDADTAHTTVLQAIHDAHTGQATQFLIPFAAYPAILTQILNMAPTLPPPLHNSRIVVMGALEARLHTFDTVILGGLNEGMWPPANMPDVWLGRALRSAIGLPMPERRIALSAHDFAQFMGQNHIILTRSVREGGAPTLPSRFLQRISAVMGTHSFEPWRSRGNAVLAQVRAHNATHNFAPIAAPTPCPAVALRPKTLSVTKIETLLHNPYAIYAEYVLGLKPLEPIGQLPDARIRGALIHTIVELAATQWSDDTQALHNSVLTEIETHTSVLPDKERILWRLQLHGVVDGIIAFEQARRQHTHKVRCEVSYRMQWDIMGEKFTIHGRADRVEQRSDGIVISDFKTGVVPATKLVNAGLYPQLVLLGEMAHAQNFEKNGTLTSIHALEYIKFTDNFTQLKASQPMGKGEALAQMRTNILDGVHVALQAMCTPTHPFYVKPYGGKIASYTDYDHLARIAEWGVLAEEDEGGEDE